MFDEKFLNHLEEGILVFGHEQCIYFANQCFLKQLYYEEPLVGYTLSDIIWEYDDEIIHLNEDKDVRIILKDANMNPVTIYGQTISGEWKEEKVTWLIIKEWSNSYYTKEELIELMDLVPYALWIEDFRGNYRYANATTVDEISHLIGRKITAQEIYEAKGDEIWEHYLKSSLWEKDNQILEVQGRVSGSRTMKLDNRMAVYHITKHALKDSKGNIRAVCCCKSSRTERRSVEAELYTEYLMQMKEEQSAELKHKNNCYEESVDDVFEIPHFLGAQDIGIYEYNREKQQVEIKSCIGEHKQFIKKMAPLPMAEEDYKRLVKEKSNWTLEEYEKRVGWPLNREQAIQVQYITQYPIDYGDELPGLLIATYIKKHHIRLFNEHTMLKIVHHLSLLIKGLKQYTSIQRDINKYKQLDMDRLELFDIPTILYSIYNVETSERIVNSGWKKLLGWDEDDVHGYEGIKVVIDEDRQEFIGRLKDIEANGYIPETISRFWCKNGDIKSIKWWMKATDYGNTVMMFGVDVTGEIQTMQKMDEYKKALEVETLKTEFLANMSHELKTPLNIIYSIEQMDEMDVKGILKEIIGDIDYKKYMARRKMMKQNIYRLLRLIDNIVDISKLGAGQYYLNLEQCNIVEIIEDITMSVALYVKGNNLNIIFDSQEEEIITGCDIEKMERIMLNLLSNAVKYSKETGEIIVNVWRQGDHVVIEVSDNGIGIPDEKQGIIFERFVQVDQSFTKKREGSGIGLALVKSLVEVMGGNIGVKSQLGEGTTFTLVLPITHMKESEAEKIKNDRQGNNRRIEKCYIEFSDIYNRDFN